MRKLYMTPLSPFARKIRIVLIEKGLDFEEDLARGIRPAQEIGAVNPALTIPVLVDGDLTLFDSALIAEYLFETYPNARTDASPPLAETLVRPEQRWRDRKVLGIMQTVLETAVTLHIFCGIGITPAQVSYLQRHQKRLVSCLDWLEEQATPEGFAPGWFTAMDISLVCALGLIDASNEHRFPPDAPMVTWRGRPNLEEVVQRFSERPSVRETSPRGFVPVSRDRYIADMLA